MLRTLISFARYPRAFFAFKKKGKNLFFGPGGRISHSKNIELGSNIYIGPNFVISGKSLEIQDNVLIGPNLLLECDDHQFAEVGSTIWSYRSNKNLAHIKIESDVWLGGNVTLLKGVVVSEGCIVGAGSVVTKSLPPYSICVGIPCRPIKTRFSLDEITQHISRVKSNYSLNKIEEQWIEYGLKY